MEATKIIEFVKKKPKAPARQRLLATERYYYLIPVLYVMYVQWEYGFSLEDIVSRSKLVYMPLNLLFPRNDYLVYNPYKLINHDIITVKDRPFEQWALFNVSNYEYWSSLKPIILSDFHRDLMEIERDVMRLNKVTNRVYDSVLEDVQHKVDEETLYTEIRMRLPAHGHYGISKRVIRKELDHIEAAFEQAFWTRRAVQFEKVVRLLLRKTA